MYQKRGRKMKVIVVGGVAAGTKAAAKLKREDRNADIRILTKGKDISYGSFTRFPDLIMMDGGRGQVNIALAVLDGAYAGIL